MEARWPGSCSFRRIEGRLAAAPGIESVESEIRMGILGLSSYLMCAALSLAGAGRDPGTANEGDRVTRSELRQLQTEVERLDDSLAEVGESDPQSGEFERRADAIREDLTRLKDQMLWGQGDEHDSNVSKGDLEAVRQATIDLRNDIDRALDSGHDVGRDLTIPDGTQMSVRLEQSLSSKTARPEDPIDASTAAPVRVDGVVVIPAGTSVRGLVQNVEPARRPARGGRLDLSFDAVFLSEGQRLDIRSRVVSVEEDKVDKSKAGLGAVLGGVLGGVLKGGEGALIGALVGGGGAVVGTKGDDVELPAGTILTLRLERAQPVARR
jgi:hypothetical protein